MTIICTRYRPFDTYAKFSEKLTFPLDTHTYVYLSEGKKCYFFQNLEVDEYSSKENLFEQSALVRVIDECHVYFSPQGDLWIHEMIIAFGINFYNSVFRLNELIT